jgi:hypothetical protein
MVKGMASLSTFINKHGKRKGKKLYNAFHRHYRKRNQKKMRLYWRTRPRKLDTLSIT